VTVIGFDDDGDRRRVNARDIQQDSSSPAASPSLR
jgi:hypothetical protein